MFNISMSLNEEAVNTNFAENLIVLEKFVMSHSKKEYSVTFLKKYLKKELSSGDIRSFEKDILDSSFSGEELDEKYEWLHSLCV